jgi:hypothetical protein
MSQLVEPSVWFLSLFNETFSHGYVIYGGKWQDHCELLIKKDVDLFIYMWFI